MEKNIFFDSGQIKIGKEMYNLAFDTTAASCSIALAKDDKILEKFSKVMDFGQSEMLIPQIKNIMQNQKVSFDDLDEITVCTGPGSFTGVRASISAARAFGLAKENIKICGVNAFDAYLASLSFCPDEIAFYNVVLIETKRQDFYYQIFDENLKALTEPSAGLREDIIAQLRNKKVTFLGDAVERFLMTPTGLSLHSIKMEEYLPIENLALKGYKQYLNKRIDYPKPLYLRAPDICIKK